MPCESSWCGKFYLKDELDCFPVRTPVDVDGQSQLQAGDGDRFQVGRNGDHLQKPFQCDLCHFWIIQGRSPLEGDTRDRRVMMLIQLANLDALWSQEPTTVARSLRNLVKTCPVAWDLSQ